MPTSLPTIGLLQKADLGSLRPAVGNTVGITTPYVVHYPRCLSSSSSSLLLSSLELSDTKSLCTFNTSPLRNRFTFLRSGCSSVENCTDSCLSRAAGTNKSTVTEMQWQAMTQAGCVSSLKRRCVFTAGGNFTM